PRERGAVNHTLITPGTENGGRPAKNHSVVKSRPENSKSYAIRGSTYLVLGSSDGYREQGVASWYGDYFHGRRTSSGDTYDMYEMTAAHKTLPLPTYVRVTNLENGRSVVLRINDRGPFIEGRIIDLSFVAAQKLGMAERGLARVEVEALDQAKAQRLDQATARRLDQATARPPRREFGNRVPEENF
ncbi:MAG: septal ring lytic transglycosylase RlpA family protein, partial [Chloroflexi bacterium]|nr:septal ring lytic transglycosylase RlpA family protein [Chloroflexota bacterium]